MPPPPQAQAPPQDETTPRDPLDDNPPRSNEEEDQGEEEEEEEEEEEDEEEEDEDEEEDQLQGDDLVNFILGEEDEDDEGSGSAPLVYDADAAPGPDFIDTYTVVEGSVSEEAYLEDLLQDDVTLMAKPADHDFTYDQFRLKLSADVRLTDCPQFQMRLRNVFQTNAAVHTKLAIRNWLDPNQHFQGQHSEEPIVAGSEVEFKKWDADNLSLIHI